MADTPVLLGSFKGADIIKTFYERCGLETIGPGRIPTGAIISYTTLEDLIDKLVSVESQQVIVVSHGHSEHGLIMKFTQASPHNATGLMIDELADLADKHAKSPLSDSDRDVTNAAAKMGIKPTGALNLVKKLVTLRAKKKMVHVRGCNLGASSSLMRGYKRAFGLVGITAPNCRNVYSGINTKKPPKGTTVDAIGARTPKFAKTRRRLFTWPQNAPVGSLVIDVRDIDGHTRLESEAFLADPSQASQWGDRLLGTWRQAPQGTNSNSFILQLFWDNGETSWHAPLEDGFRQKLVFV
jgi:hypothetical protein